MLGSTYTATDTTISYTYDDLNRLTAADYSNGMYYHYGYDAVGNRLQQVSAFLADPVTTEYTYDNANRLATVGSQAYTFDANGNLLSDGTNTYTYDTANRLVGVVTAATAVTYRYNGDGNRLQSSSNGVDTNYTLELNSGLSQVLADGTNTYLYGANRIGMSNTTGNYLYEYDALGSVRQMENIAGLTLAQSYDPYGNVILSSGQAGIYGFTGEQQSVNGLVYLRSRTYNPSIGTFSSRDTWSGDADLPMSYNRWMYVYGNPVNYADPSGFISCENSDDSKCIDAMRKLLDKATVLKTQVMTGEPQLQPVEALAQLTAYSYELFEHDRRGMMWGMTKVLVRIDPNDYHYLSLQPVNQLVLDELEFENIKGPLHEDEYTIGENWLDYRTKSGKLLRGDWKKEYFDGTPNQAFHFWYYAASRFFDGNVFGVVLGNLANVVHDPYYLEEKCGEDLENLKESQNEILKEWSKRTHQTSKEDFDLAQKGIQYGRYIGGPGYLPIYPDKWIRNNLKEK